MRTLRQIEEEFRQLDKKQGRQNPYYSKDKLTKKSSGRDSFWDVLAPGENILENENQNLNGTNGRNSSFQNSTHNSLNINNSSLHSSNMNNSLVRLRPTAVQNRITSIAEKAQSSMNDELNIRRKDMKQVIKRATSSTPDSAHVTKRRASVFSEAENANKFLQNSKTKSNLTSSPGTKHLSDKKFEKSFTTNTKANDKKINSLNQDIHKKSNEDRNYSSNYDTEQSNQASNWSFKKTNVNNFNTKVKSNSINDPNALKQVEKQLEARESQIKKTLNQISYEDKEFYQFRIRVQNNSNLNLKDISRVFIIVTQDDNPSLITKIHDLGISDDMYILFPSSLLNDKSLFSPTEYLPWINEPIDLLHHKLTVEIFVGIGGETSIIAKSTVEFSEIEELGSSKLNDTKSKVDVLGKMIDDKKYLKKFGRTSEVEDYDYFLSPNVTNQEIDFGRKNSDSHNENNIVPLSTKSNYSYQSHQSHQLHQEKPLKVLKIVMHDNSSSHFEDTNNSSSSYEDDTHFEDTHLEDTDLQDMNHYTEIQHDLSKSNDSNDTLNFMSQKSLEEYALQRSSLNNQNKTSILVDSIDDLSEFKSNRNQDYSEDYLGVNSPASRDLLNSSVDTNGSSLDDYDSEDGDDEGLKLEKSKQELQALRERLKNKMRNVS